MNVSDNKIRVSGLSDTEAARRLKSEGPNSMPDISAHPLLSALGKFWAHPEGTEIATRAQCLGLPKWNLDHDPIGKHSYG